MYSHDNADTNSGSDSVCTALLCDVLHKIFQKEAEEENNVGQVQGTVSTRALTFYNCVL